MVVKKKNNLSSSARYESATFRLARSWMRDIWYNIITKTHLYSFDPLKPHFYIVKLGFTGVYINFLFLLKNIDCGYTLEPPHRGGSNAYSQSMFWTGIWKISDFFIWKFSLFGCKIFNIFVQACFRNVMILTQLKIVVSILLVITIQMVSTMITIVRVDPGAGNIYLNIGYLKILSYVS